MKKLCQIFIVTAFVVATSLTLYAHSGRTDSSGGHTNRSTGQYHYHNSGSGSTAPKPSTPAYTPTYTPPVAPQTQDISPAPTPVQTVKPVVITENHWQVALNNKVFNGQMEVSVSTGRVDITTDQYVVEVDKVSKYTEGIEQVLRYALATGKKPVLALYIDGEKGGYEALQQADKLCKEKGVTLLLANCYVSVNDLISLVLTANASSTTSTGISSTTSDLNCWITTSSGVRHNSSCRYYMNSNGRKCSKNEGRACKICGG